MAQKLSGVRDLQKILETTAKDLGETLNADSCQIMLSNPLNPNITSIYEHCFQKDKTDKGNKLTMPLVLHGQTFGLVSLKLSSQASQQDINAVRVTLGELGDVIHYAQINDIIQRDTFQETFLVEIGNVMAYSLGIGDALFMVVNILGKVLKVSRCLFICTDDTQAGWKCYEYWQQDKVPSCQDYCWPTTDSAIVAQTLLSRAPLKILEGQLNSYVSPVQEELSFMGAKSLLGIALTSAASTHGCVILQQCDYRRAWTRSEIDMVQNVADKVAESLIKLPAEKRVREPIMQLHQRIVQPGKEAETRSDKPKGHKMDSVRKALKGALVEQAIPSAAKTSFQKPPGKSTGPLTKSTIEPPVSQAELPAPRAISPSSSISQITQSTISAAPPEPPPVTPPEVSSDAAFDQKERKSSDIESKQRGEEPCRAERMYSGGGEGTEPTERLQKIAGAEIETAQSSSDLSPDLSYEWGDLNSIPSPSSGPALGGLSGVMLGKAKASSPVQSPLMSSFYKERGKHIMPEEAPVVTGPPLQIDEAKAQEKLNEILSSSNPTSDYIFATPGLHSRMLGRIDGWVFQIEQKDRYLNGHARQVAEYATAIGRQLGMSQPEIDILRQAALVHDVGKLGSQPQILQKPDEELSDLELIQIMKHPIDGAELLESFPDLKLLAPIVKAHHEEYDGNGYPQGLKGEEIPLASRIISVANSYHGMVSPLRYREGMNTAAAKEELVKGAGKQWDPAVVEALIQCLDSKT